MNYRGCRGFRICGCRAQTPKNLGFGSRLWELKPGSLQPALTSEDVEAAVAELQTAAAGAGPSRAKGGFVECRSPRFRVPFSKDSYLGLCLKILLGAPCSQDPSVILCYLED